MLVVGSAATQMLFQQGLAPGHGRVSLGGFLHGVHQGGFEDSWAFTGWIPGQKVLPKGP